MNYQIPDAFLHEDFTVNTHRTQNPQLHLQKLPPIAESEKNELSPDIISFMINQKQSSKQTQIFTYFDKELTVDLQQIKLDILKALESDTLLQMSREQIQLFLNSDSPQDEPLKKFIRDTLKNPLAPMKQFSQILQTPVQRIQQLQQNTRDKHAQGSKRYYCKKLIYYLLGDYRNPMLGRMIFSQIGEKISDFHRLRLNNSLAYFRVQKGPRNEIADPIITNELSAGNLYAYSGRTVVLEHFEPLSLSLQLPGMAARPSFVGYTYNDEVFKRTVSEKYYQNKKFGDFPPIPISNYISTYERLKAYNHQFQPFFYSENVDYAMPFIEFCHGFAPFTSYALRNRFLLTRNRKNEIRKEVSQPIQYNSNQLQLSSSEFVLRELPYAFFVGQFLPQYNMEMRQAENKKAETSKAQSQPDPRMVVFDIYRKERAIQYASRIAQAPDIDKKQIEKLAQRIFPKEAKVSQYLKQEGNRVNFTGTEDFQGIAQLTMHVLLYENQIATTQFAYSFLKRCRFVNYLEQICKYYTKFSHMETSLLQHEHAWFMTDRFLGWVNLVQNFITNHRLAKYYTIQNNADVDIGTHVIVDRNTYLSFAPQQYKFNYQIDQSLLRLLGFDLQGQKERSQVAKVEDYMKKQIPISDPFSRNFAFNVNAMRVQRAKQQLQRIGLTFQHWITQNQQKGQKMYDEIDRNLAILKEFPQFKDEVDIKIEFEDSYSAKRSSKDAKDYLEQLQVNVDLLIQDYERRSTRNLPSEIENAQIFNNASPHGQRLNELTSYTFHLILDKNKPANNDRNQYLMDVGKRIVHFIGEKSENDKGKALQQFLSSHHEQFDNAMKFFAKSDDPFNTKASKLFQHHIRFLTGQQLRPEELLTKNTQRQNFKFLDINYEELRQFGLSNRQTSCYQEQKYFDIIHTLGQVIKESRIQDRDITKYSLNINGQLYEFDDKNMYDCIGIFIKQIKEYRDVENEYAFVTQNSDELLDEQYCYYAGSAKYVSPVVPGNQNQNYRYAKEQPSEEQLKQLNQYIKRQQTNQRYQQIGEITNIPVQQVQPIQPYLQTLSTMQFTNNKCIIQFDQSILEKGEFIDTKRIKSDKVQESNLIQRNINTLPFDEAIEIDGKLLKNFQLAIDIEALYNNPKSYVKDYVYPQGLNSQISQLQQFLKEQVMSTRENIDQQVKFCEAFFRFDEGMHLKRLQAFYYNLDQQVYSNYKLQNNNQDVQFLQDIEREATQKTKPFVSYRYYLVYSVIQMIKLILKVMLNGQLPWKWDLIQSEYKIRQLYDPELEIIDGVKFGSYSYYGSVLYLLDQLRNWRSHYQMEMDQLIAIRMSGINAGDERPEFALFCCQLVQEENKALDQLLGTDLFANEYLNKTGIKK